MYAIIRDPEIPVPIRARFKTALDQGAIRLELDAFGNGRIQARHTGAFPIDVTVPLKVPNR